MDRREASSTREWLKLFLQLLCVASCSVPATAIYFLMLSSGVPTVGANLIGLVAGFGCAYFGWRWLDTKMVAKQPVVVVKVVPVMVRPLQDAVGFAGTLAVVIVAIVGGQSTCYFPLPHNQTLVKGSNLLVKNSDVVANN